MIRNSRLTAMLCTVICAGVALPAAAQYTNEYVPPKLTHRGTTSKAIAGSGTVVVQVQVNPNGSHKALRVIRSSNPANDAAALDIAQNSSYRPAHRGTTAVSSFYDFTLRFTGKSVAASQQSGGSGSTSGVSGQIDRMIRAGNYTGAKAKAQSALESNSGDPVLNSQLGAANYFLNDPVAAAQAFSQVSNVPHVYAQVAANSYVQAAQKLANTNPTQAMAYAQKAVSLAPNSGGAYYALGAAELANHQSAAAVTDLTKARQMVFADRKSDRKSRVNVDSELYAAQKAAGDSAGAQTTLAEIKRLDPNNPAVGRLQANTYLMQGQAAEKAGNFPQAISAFEQAASVAGGDQQVLVTAYASAAFATNQMIQAQKSPATVSDYGKMKAYADKAVAAGPNDAEANYAEGIALAGQYIVGGKSDASLKGQALSALSKAKSEAQAAGNMTIAINVDNFIKQYLQ
ncbi:MAG TPA: TonB family protein [Candidatus Baltobacteraceae bacterium]|nr:TonB family protein [Candidatus Baltobacteraceae bacterium]